MIDPGIPARVQSSDAAGRASGSRSDRSEDAGGFSNALSDAGSKSQKSSSASDENSSLAKPGNDNGAGGNGNLDQAAEGETDELGNSGRGTSNKPIIDIRGHASFSNTRQAKASASGEAEQLAGNGDDAVAQENSKADGKQRSAASGTKNAYDTLLTQDGAATAAAEGTNKSGTRDKKAGETDDENANGLEDVLSLLAGGAEVAAAAGAQGSQAARHAMRGSDNSDQKVDAVTAKSGEGRQVSVDADTASLSADDTTADTADTGGRNFRFARADGKGQPLILSIGAGADGRARAEAAQAGSEGTQNITVVDARRYLAPASTSNLANVTGALTGNPDWSSAMQPGSELANAASQSSTGNVVNTLKIQLHPIDLGQVTATLRLSGEALTIHLTVENSAAMKSLNDDQGELMKALRSHGFAVDNVQITMASTPDRSAADSGQNNAQQQAGQQASAQGGNNQSSFAGGGQSGEQRTSGDVDVTNRTGMTSDDTNAATTASGNAGGARPDHVYI
ncbi:flagellar hook-length control protein FliK [Agrobacterium sp. ES01]|uniref:flagellar hook-length control protein FliK n=1 Tax=Agrobacterium sp. ES01 TaxID=3420714 RepID=UPI003D0FEAE4